MAVSIGNHMPEDGTHVLPVWPLRANRATRDPIGAPGIALVWDRGGPTIMLPIAYARDSTGEQA